MSEYDKMCENLYERFKGDIENNLVASLNREVQQLKDQLESSYRRY